MKRYHCKNSRRRSCFSNELVEFLNVEVQHFICDAFDVILLELELDPKEDDFLLGEVD
jgi:hypothetical protein